MNNAWRLSRGTLSFSVFVILLASRPPPGFCADRLQTIHDRGELRWGADAEGGAPYVYPDPQKPEQMAGFEYDLAAALAERLGVKSKMVQNQWDQLLPALDRGNFDVILNGLEITADNRQHAAMSRPYYVYAQQIVTRADFPGPTNLETLKGQTVGVLASSAGQRLLQRAGGIEVKSYPGNVESLLDLKARRIDVVVLDRPIALYYAKPDAALKFSGPPFSPGYYGLAMRKEDQTLLAAVNMTLEQFIRDGTLEKIYRRHGLWDERQAALADYQPENVVQKKSISTLREWPKYLPLLLRGAVITVVLSVLGMALAVVLGLVVVLARLYGPAPLRWLAQAYVEVVRGTPLLIQLFMIYYGLPQIGVSLNAFLAGILGLGLNYAANEAENYRAGIQSIPKGQTEAALALGMTRGQILRRIVLPQALRLVIPPVTNDFISMFKDSSIVSVITMVELTKVYGELATATYDYIGLGLMTAAIYFALSYPASIFAGRLERKLSHDRS